MVSMAADRQYSDVRVQKRLFLHILLRRTDIKVMHLIKIHYLVFALSVYTHASALWVHELQLQAHHSF